MADRGTSNSPNTRNPQRPASKPSRLEQYADDMFDLENEMAEELGITSNKEARALRRSTKAKKE